MKRPVRPLLGAFVLLAMSACDDGSATTDATTGGGGQVVSACISCEEIWDTRERNPNEVCRGQAESALSEAFGCMCDTCRADCLDNACQAADPSDACLACLDADCASEQDTCRAN